MDVSLNKLPMEGYACPLETVVYQEETQESIVPDACPDIGRVICTDARVQLTRKEAMEGKLEWGGDIRVTVVYLCEEGNLHSMELTIPFRGSAAGAVSPGCPSVVCVEVRSAETRVLNPRKVLCRVELAASVQVWTPCQETVCLPTESPECPLEQRMKEMETYIAVATAEKAFAFTDDVALPASHPAAAQLLGHRIQLHCSDAKVIGGKLIFKGEAVLYCRYRTDSGVLALGRWELPFSQLMELEGVDEEGSCAVEIAQRESQVTLTGDEEGRTLNVHMELLAQAVVRQNRTLRLMEDAYSTTHSLTVERQSLTITQLWEESGVDQQCREILETADVIDRVEDCAVTVGPCQVRREEQEGILTAQAWARVLYTDDAGILRALERELELSARIPLPPKGECRCRCALSGEAQALPAAGGIELRVPARFAYLTTVSHTRSAVTALQAEEREEELRPSVRLRLVQPGEDLWDVAKSCSAARADILAANDLSEDADSLAGTLLLIPKSR